MKSKAKRLLSVLSLVLILTLPLGACSAKVKADISSYEDTPITITGLADEPFETTPGELSEMKCVRQTTKGNTAKAGTVTAVGPTLETFAANHGRELSEFEMVIFYGSDGYLSVADREILKENDIILSLSNGDEPLEERQQPLRIIIPNVDSGKWTRLVNEIEFVE